jgi:hypothetical protein
MEWGRPPYPLTRGCELRKHPVPGTIAIAIAIEDYARDQIEEAHRSHQTRCASNPGCFTYEDLYAKELKEAFAPDKRYLETMERRLREQWLREQMIARRLLPVKN